jgi:hypothetical protein
MRQLRRLQRDPQLRRLQFLMWKQALALGMAIGLYVPLLRASATTAEKNPRAP